MRETESQSQAPDIILTLYLAVLRQTHLESRDEVEQEVKEKLQ